MPPPRESMGAIPCLCCAQSVPVKKSSGGALSVSCPWCDLSAYAKEGTQAYRKIMAKLPQPEPAPAKKQEAAPPPPPAPKPKSSNPFFPG